MLDLRSKLAKATSDRDVHLHAIKSQIHIPPKRNCNNLHNTTVSSSINSVADGLDTPLSEIIPPAIKSQKNSWNKWVNSSLPQDKNLSSSSTGSASSQIPMTNDSACTKRPSGDCEIRASADLQKKARVDKVKALTGLVCLEICAGSAKLSAALKHSGFQVVPIDHGKNQHQQRVHCVQINLAEEGSFALIKSILEEVGIFYVHLAPPCGTASAARSRPVAPELIAAGFPSPPPLRSKQQPLGLDGLSQIQQARVDQANSIYRLCAKVLSLCIERNIIVSVENPARSLFWEIPFIKHFLSHPALEKIRFHHCMLGGDRDKETIWLGTKNVFSSLALACDKQHSHKPWGGTMVNGKPVFDTAGESEYPGLLCETVAFIIRDQAVIQGFSLPPDSLDGELSQAQLRHKLQAGVGKQARGRKLPQLVPEFISVNEHVSPIGQKLELDKSQSVLRRFLRAEVGDLGSPQKHQVHIIGTRRDPGQFFEMAVKAGHPYNPGASVSDDIRRSLYKILTLGPLQLKNLRLSSLAAIEEIADKQSEQERALHEELPRHLKEILKGKKILLFKTLLENSGFKDVKIVDEMCRGFDVVGRAGPSGILESRLKPATCSADQLRKSSKISRKAILSSNRKSSDPELDAMVYDITQQELKDNWIEGPYDEGQVDKIFQDGWLAIPRFGIRQGSKVRAIDDGKLPGLNTALTTVDKLLLQDTDDLCALISFVSLTIRSAKLPSRSFTIALKSGEIVTGSIHEDWGNIADIKLQGRTLDLSAAYKNVGNSSSTLWACVIAVWNAKKPGYEMYISNALMFGATASVYAFNRVAKALQHVAIHYLSILANQFFDDFPCCEPEATASSARGGFESLLRLLGWQVASGEKSPEFCSTFNALGNTLDIAGAISKGTFEVGNKQSRIRNITDIISAARSSGSLRPPLAAELAGKLQYSSAQVFGDAARPAIRCIRDRAEQTDGKTDIDYKLDFALSFVQDNILTALPRQVKVDFSDEPIFVFTDGSSEGSEHLWGAVIFGAGKSIVAQGRVPMDLTDFWLAEVGKQIICQVELYPVLLVKVLLRRQLSLRRVLFYIDNDPSRDGLISGSSDSCASRAMLYKFSSLQRQDPSFNWFARVPSFSNFADDPSRGRGKELAHRLGATFCTDWTLSRDDLLELKTRC